ncbi:hypothetical protein GCK32_021220 [Trichostrongylus colubriformis]|uniref:Uncharacterized protein n=1 Tax=Trichostrongylus colubriformis TaxID=6319 RepID=A0AAN8FDN4_TRICO
MPLLKGSLINNVFYCSSAWSLIHHEEHLQERAIATSHSDTAECIKNRIDVTIDAKAMPSSSTAKQGTPTYVDVTTISGFLQKPRPVLVQ